VGFPNRSFGNDSLFAVHISGSLGIVDSGVFYYPLFTSLVMVGFFLPFDCFIFHCFVFLLFNFNILKHKNMDKDIKIFQVKTKFIFEGIFEVKAQSKEQAREFVEKDCGLVIGGDVHSTLPDEDINWEFSVHPDKEIKGIKQIKRKLYESK
jgi:hypothetical protein